MVANVISRRYADALFNASLKINEVDTVYSDLGELSDKMESNREFRYFMLTPRIKKSRKIELISRLFTGRFSDITLNFLYLLMEKRRQEYIRRIFQYYKNLYDKHHNRMEIKTIAPVELTDVEKEKISDVLADVTGKEVTLMSVVDHSLIGGLVTQIGNKVYDDSIKGHLELIRKEMAE